MKYFYLSERWTTGRVWEFGGLWNELAWNRKPYLRKRSLCIKEQGETLCLYEAEESILMVEVMPQSIALHTSNPAIGQVVLKRLLSAEQAIERLCQEDHIFQHPARHSHNASDTHTATTDQRAKRPITDNLNTGNLSTGNLSTGSINVDEKDNELSSNHLRQNQPSTEADKRLPALQTRAMKTRPVNQAPVAINDDGEQS